MNINEPSTEFDKWLAKTWYNVPIEHKWWEPTSNVHQAITLLESWCKRNPGWWVDIGYCPDADLPWRVWLRKDGEEYQPSANGYPLSLMICQVLALVATNGEIWEE